MKKPQEETSLNIDQGPKQLRKVEETSSDLQTFDKGTNALNKITEESTTL